MNLRFVLIVVTKWFVDGLAESKKKQINSFFTWKKWWIAFFELSLGLVLIRLNFFNNFFYHGKWIPFVQCIQCGWWLLINNLQWTMVRRRKQYHHTKHTAVENLFQWKILITNQLEQYLSGTIVLLIFFFVRYFRYCKRYYR